MAIKLGRGPQTATNRCLDRIRFAQTRGFTQVNIALDHASQKDAQALTAFCRELYEYSFLARSFYSKAERNLRLTLQTAPQIRDFFAGAWFEWFVLMQVLELCSGGAHPLCLRAEPVGRIPQRGLARTRPVLAGPRRTAGVH